MDIIELCRVVRDEVSSRYDIIYTEPNGSLLMTRNFALLIVDGFIRIGHMHNGWRRKYSCSSGGFIAEISIDLHEPSWLTQLYDFCDSKVVNNSNATVAATYTTITDGGVQMEFEFPPDKQIPWPRQ